MNSFQKVVAPVLKGMRPAPDFVEEYKQDFGYVGPALCAAVAKARTQPTTLTTTTAATTTLTANQQQGPTTVPTKPLVQSGKVEGARKL